MRDSQRNSLYASEDAIFDKSKTPEYQTLVECKAFALIIVDSKYWKSQKGRKRFSISDGRGRRSACASSKGIHDNKDVVSLPKWSRSRWIIIHEFCHLLSNTTDHNTEPHGAVFCKHYLNLVRELLSEDCYLKLKNSFDVFGIRYLQ